VVAACATGEQTLAAVRAHRPDVLELDLRMRGLAGRPASIVRCTRTHLPMDCALLSV
jgi:CheY-like chemotaxis protein